MKTVLMKQFALRPFSVNSVLKYRSAKASVYHLWTVCGYYPGDPGARYFDPVDSL